MVIFMSHKCGNCSYFIKLKQMRGNSGVCEYYDARTSEDYGRTCVSFKRMKYSRSKSKLLLDD
jgi:hypothetical protein